MFPEYEELTNLIYDLYPLGQPEVQISAEHFNSIKEQLQSRWMHIDPAGPFFYIGQTKIRSNSMLPKLEVFKGKNKRWYWRLVAKNHQIVCSSDGGKAGGYPTKKSATHAAKRSRAMMLSANVVEA